MAFVHNIKSFRSQTKYALLRGEHVRCVTSANQYGSRTATLVYVGRLKGTNNHFGNPFTHKQGTMAELVVPTRGDAVFCFGAWLGGNDQVMLSDSDQYWIDVEEDRRQWILDNLHTLKHKDLVCWCHPKPCHAAVLLDFIDHIIPD
jgi:hypothetical protein